MDLSMHDKEIELCYELCSGGEKNQNLKFSFCSCASPNSDYLYSCFYLSDSFGCDGLHFKQQNCILNKKYPVEEYESLKKRIIEHMKKTGAAAKDEKEYGEFFPIQLSLHPYNLSNAQDEHPLDRETALKKGYKWKDQDPSEYQKATAILPANIEEVTDSITKETLACSQCSKNYRIILQELVLNRRMKQSLSTLCPDCRLLKLSALKNPRKLWNRTCAKCQKEIQTTYSSDRPENVYCEYCYLKEVY